MSQLNGVKIHDFTERVAWSNQLGKEATWADFYRRIWPNLLACVKIDKDSQWQRWGIDRVVYLPEGRQVQIDEKVREFRNSRIYDDFLMEVWSDYEKKKPGWTLDRSKRCDFIAYAVPQLSKCYLLPFELLRMTCHWNLESWKRYSSPTYPVIAKSRSNGRCWETWNCSITWDRLFAAMREQMQREFVNGDLKLPLPITDDHGQLIFNFDNSEKPEKASEINPDSLDFDW